MKSIRLSYAIASLSCLISCENKKNSNDIPAPRISLESSSSSEPPATCTDNLLQQCLDLQGKIASLQLDIKKHADTLNFTAMQLSQLELNEALETLDSLRIGNINVEAITARYAVLRMVIEKRLNQNLTIEQLIYRPEEISAVNSVFSELGPLSLSPQQISNEKDTSELTSWQIEGAQVPWSAFWYPKRGREMFNGPNSPLAKLDRYLRSKNLESTAQQWEDSNYDANSADWEGMCDSWAMSAILLNEPSQALLIDGIFFTVSDFKALAIKYFEGYSSKIYGRRHQGQSQTDGLMQDLRPEAFHRIMEVVLGEKKQAVVIDEDNGPEVWSKPLYRYAFTSAPDPEMPFTVKFKAFPWLSKQRSVVDEKLTGPSTDRSAPMFEYRLTYNQDAELDGRYLVVAGEWINKSVNFHPDTVLLQQEPSNDKQTNPSIRTHHEELRKLLELAGLVKSTPFSLVDYKQQ